MKLLFNKVSVIRLYGCLNIKNLQLLGCGTQGKVYRIDTQRCIKIFKRRQECRDEFEALTIAQIDWHFPRLYQYGENYIIREYINGVELNKYLSAHPLTPNISSKIIELYEAVIKVGYNRLHLRDTYYFLKDK